MSDGPRRAAPDPVRRGPLEAFRVMDGEQRIAAVAALALACSLFLPWWRDPVFEVSYVAVRRITFLEVALLLVAIGVLVLLVRRAEGRFFHLPLSDATLVAVAGAWSAILVVFRIIDGPTRTVGATTRDYELRFGAFVALAAAVGLVVAGVRERRRRHPGEAEAAAADADATPTVDMRY